MVPEQAQLLLAHLDRAAAKLGDQDLVAGLHAGRHALSLAVECAGADGNYFCLVELLHRGFGQEDSRGCLGFRLDALHEDAVEERGDGADGFDGRLLGRCVLVGLELCGGVVWRYMGDCGCASGGCVGLDGWRGKLTIAIGFGGVEMERWVGGGYHEN